MYFTNLGLLQAPWMASIGTELDSNWNHICSGSIISDNKILTLAKCIEDRSNLIKIKVGAEYLTNISTIYDIENVLIHNETAEDSLAILITTQIIEINEYTKPICLTQLPDLDIDNIGDVIVELMGKPKHSK